MSSSKGIARTQYSSGAANKSGAITVAATLTGGAAGSIPIQLSNEGTKDFLLHATGGSPNDPYSSQGSASIHGKRLGGYIRRCGLWRYFGPGGTLAAAAIATSPWAFTTTLGDDDTSNGTSPNNFANALNIMIGYTANNGVLVITGGFGFVVPALASAAAVRTMNVYCGFSSGGVRTDTQFEILARLLDGSSGDASLIVTPGVVGLKFYKVTFTFRSAGEGVPFIARFTANQQGADGATQIVFGAATMF
jgi:hypothetical protein